MPKFIVELDLSKRFFYQMDGESLDVECITYALREIADAIDAKDRDEAPLDAVLHGMTYVGSLLLGAYMTDE